MKVKGSKTTTEYCDFDIQPHVVVDAVLELFDKKYPGKGDHIGCDGYWQILDYIHPHNGDYVFSRGEAATSEEIELCQIRKLIYELRNVK